MRADRIVGVNEVKAAGTVCSYVVANGHQRLVQGTDDAILEKVLVAMPHCSHAP